MYDLQKVAGPVTPSSDENNGMPCDPERRAVVIGRIRSITKMVDSSVADFLRQPEVFGKGYVGDEMQKELKGLQESAQNVRALTGKYRA